MKMVIAALALIALVALIRAAAARVQLQDPLLLLAAGLGLSFVPGVPSYRMSPDLILGVVLPLLLYAEAFNTSLPAFRANLRAILLLSVGLTLFMTLVVGYVASAVIPGLALAAGLVLGAVLAPLDAVAASAVGRQARVPHRVLTLLEGEGLFNDAAALTAYAVAVSAVGSESFSLLAAGGRFVLASFGGLAVGAAVALLVAYLRARIQSPLSDVTLSLLTPFMAYLPAEAIHASGLVAVVIVGLYLGHRAPTLMDPPSRVLSPSVWRLIEHLLEGAMFIIMGLQFAEVVQGVTSYAPVLLASVSAALIAVMTVGRFVWVFLVTYLPRLLSRRLRERDPYLPWQFPTLVSWAGMRGVVSFAAVFALPVILQDGAAFPQRNLLVFLTLVIIVTSVLGQGLTLPTLIRRLRLPASVHPDQEAQRDAEQEAEARHAAATAALHRLDELVEAGTARSEVADQLRQRAAIRQLAAQEALEETEGTRSFTAETYRYLARQMIVAERDQFTRMRDDGRLSNAVFTRVLRELDLEESTLLRRS